MSRRCLKREKRKLCVSDIFVYVDNITNVMFYLQRNVLSINYLALAVLRGFTRVHLKENI